MVQRGTGTLKLSNFIELSDAPFWLAAGAATAATESIGLYLIALWTQLIAVIHIEQPALDGIIR